MRRYMTVARAARKMGVDHELIRGLVQSRKLDGFVEPGKTGQKVWFIYTDQLERFRP